MADGPRLLLDTCVLYFISGDQPMRTQAVDCIEEAKVNGRLFVSPFSAWEIGQSMRSGKLKSPLSAIEFFEETVRRSVGKLCMLSPAMLAGSSFLPHLDHRDPADCVIIASARSQDFVLVTRDRVMLDYGVRGYVKVLAC